MPALSIDNLSFRYPGSSAPVVNIPSLSLEPAEQLLLTGGSGRGKSTLLQLIAGLMDPQTGTITINGTRIHALPPSKRDEFRGRHIGMIFQTFNLLLGFTAKENVLAALLFANASTPNQHTHATELLSWLGIDRPDARVEHLSVGQQQRVAVARALACSPTLVLADEQTASLDPANAALAMDLIQSACKSRGAALLCVSHDPQMNARFPRVLALESLSPLPEAAR